MGIINTFMDIQVGFINIFMRIKVNWQTLCDNFGLGKNRVGM